MSEDEGLGKDFLSRLSEGIMSKKQLAIVIPAYKARFLAATLESICRQSCQEFSLYIGDDCSPEPIYEVVRSFEERREIYYVRFEENLGHKSLVKQWERCIALSNEPWIWLFGDDDIMETDCVREFLRQLKPDNRSEVYRFDSAVIDDKDRICSLNPPHPDWESWIEFAYFWLRGLRSCILQDFVFSRRAYDTLGGFLDLPLAWGSDVALLLELGLRGGIYKVSGSRVLFRNSGYNISSIRDRTGLYPKIKAYMMFVEWLHNFMCANYDPDFELSSSVLISLTCESFITHLERQHHLYTIGQISWISSFMSRIWGDSTLINVIRIIKVNLKCLYVWLRRNVKKK